MTMSGGNSSSMNSEINVTPMIDVLLVLLIIFMVIVPAIPKGESAQLPWPALQPTAAPNPDTVVLEVLNKAGGEAAFRINRHDVARHDLPARLAAIYANRAERVLYVQGDDGLSFSQIAQAIDIGHAAGVEHVGLLTPGVRSSL